MNRPFILVDNYDSFTMNLVTYLHHIADDFCVIKNDDITIEQCQSLNPQAIMISPGPGRPEESGQTLAVTAWAVNNKLPFLGVCLGHQALAMHFGARLKSARSILHGHCSWIHHDGCGIYQGLPNPLKVGRYHSLVIDPKTLPECLMISAHSDDGDVMGVRHVNLPFEGVQFHPESVLTPQGREVLANFTHLF